VYELAATHDAERSNGAEAGKLSAGDLQRSRGEMRLVLKRGSTGTAPDRLFESGCLRLRIPRNAPDAQLEAVLINSAGGLTGGDRLDVFAEWQAQTAGCITTQAAEKIYRAVTASAVVNTTLVAKSGADAEWLPQETILFNRAALDRHLDVRLSKGARLLLHESIIFGRTAMGEEVTSGSIRDGWQIHRESRLIYADVFRLEGEIAAQLDSNVVAAGSRACGTILLIADDIALEMLSAVREVLAHSPAWAAASSWNGILAVRFLAANGEILKSSVTDVLSVLRAGRAAPKMWRC
jgi:urease accessory protein